MTDQYYQAALDISSSSLKIGEEMRFRVNGQSMKPLLRPGDFVIARVVPLSELSRGDLIVVRREADLVTHRLVAVDAEGWHTKGDGTRYADPPVPARSIIGLVVAIERGDSSVSVQTGRWQTINRILGWIGWLESGVYRVGKRLKIRLFGNKKPRWMKALERLVGLPFLVIKRLLLP